MDGQLLNRLEKVEKRIVDLYSKLSSPSSNYSRNVITLPVPTLDSVVTVDINTIDTIITFEDALVYDFSLNITTGPNLSKGDRIYLMVKKLNNGQPSPTITVGSILNPVTCGSPDSSINVSSFLMICHEMVYDGEKFTGIDNC